ncbi:MAG: hypothetical protein ACLGI6_04905 [Gammaproteobacteria bacterium]
MSQTNRMNDDLSTASLWVQIAIAAVSGGVAYLVIAGVVHALFARGSDADRLGQYVAIAAGLLVFGLVLYRIRHGSWPRESLDELLDIDLDD